MDRKRKKILPGSTRVECSCMHPGKNPLKPLSRRSATWNNASNPDARKVVSESAFSWKERLQSFRFAWSGLVAIFRTEHNAWIHAALTLVVLFLSFLFDVSRTECMMLIIVITIVWLAEFINTAIEKGMDFISLEKHPQIKLVKDLAAAAVLLSAVAAFVIGIFIFLPKIINHV